MEKLKALASYLEVEESELTKATYSHYNNGEIYTFGNQEYAVYDDIDEARDAAIEANRQLIEDENCLPNLPISEYISHDWAEEFASEEANYAVENDGPFDKDDEGRTKEDFIDEIKSEFIDRWAEDGQLTDEQEEALDALIELVVKEKTFDKNSDGDTEESIYNSKEELVLSDPYNYLLEFYDEDSLAKFLVEKGALDTEAMAEECVSCDGIPHLLASYDGEEIDLDGGFIAFRLN